MGCSKPMKKINRKMSTDPTMKHISNDLVTEILARVASSSLTDFFNVKLTSCKEFYQFRDDHEILQRVSLEEVPIVQWHLSYEVSSFLDRCKESQNPEILYRQGLVEFFSHKRSHLGIELLKKAANVGHAEASYSLGMILLCDNDEARYRKGVELLKMVEISKPMGVKECRNRLKRDIRRLWINNFLSQQKVVYSMCSNSACNENGGNKRGWISDGDEEFISCGNCKWDRELVNFCNMLRGFC